MAETPAKEPLPIIGIGLKLPGAPPSNHRARCQLCRDEHEIQPSTAKTIRQLGARCIVACVRCIRDAAQRAGTDTVTAQGIESFRRREGLPEPDGTP